MHAGNEKTPQYTNNFLKGQTTSGSMIFLINLFHNRLIMKWNCIIVDDTEIDNLTVVSYVKRFPVFELMKSFTSAKEASQYLTDHQPDVIFLDIDMPKVSGFELRRQAIAVPACIFITSHPEYALDGFELDALDFIVKPLSLERFSRTVARIEQFMDLRNKASLFDATIGSGAIFIKEGHAETKVKLIDILYLEALKNYTLIITRERTHRVLVNIGTLLQDAHFKSFIRVHRGFAVHSIHICKIRAQEVELIDEVVVPIGRNYKENLNVLL